MEVTRRQFTRLIVSAALALAAGARGLAAHAAPARFLKALKPSAFPGRLRPLDDAQVRKPGPWSG